LLHSMEDNWLNDLIRSKSFRRAARRLVVDTGMNDSRGRERI